MGVAAAESGLVPDRLIRAAIRRLCAARLRDCARRFAPRNGSHPFLASLKSGPIALVPELANDQHYELPPEFFELILGPHRKYSCCLFSEQNRTLAQAEAAALEETCVHAQLADGQSILELGCGWGSLSLWMAEKFPNSQVTAISNSRPQREWIESVAVQKRLTNLRVITGDMNDFSVDGQKFDRVVSVEMFEHMRNYDRLLEKVSNWLTPEGRLFVHVFSHRDYLYPFEEAGAGDWMATHFFSGGLMPSSDLFHHFAEHFTVEAQWTWNGRHYQQTADAWLDRLDAHREGALHILRSRYGEHEARRWLQRWRMFFLAVSELFGFQGGHEWQVVHCRLTRSR